MIENVKHWKAEVIYARKKLAYWKKRLEHCKGEVKRRGVKEDPPNPSSG